MEGSAIRDIRRRLGITQIELGERLGVDQGTVSRWERQVENPRPATLARLRSLLERDEERRAFNRSLAIVRCDLRPASLLDQNLRLVEISASGKKAFTDRGQDPFKLMGTSFETYSNRIGAPHLRDHLLESGFLDGAALLFSFTVNARGNGNVTIWEPLTEDGQFIGALNYITSFFDFPANDEFTIEKIGFVATDNPGTFHVTHAGQRAHLIDGASLY
ncbi:helix-turn-helix transcriptional regulator [Thioclava sp. DLFJ4-1]|uniref:helix-turn-helix domain-containing protein n=1 Tax=Thioclava sp. DLFJ4-1 TaxID=1915313 RepID=UPI0009CA1C42|nr:helix-turn-helix transcriptional regulator [Thioclava sp. DLFJ4-1]OOY17420.1 hypothetical protein BMI85_00120 [Thioclava sp. DLFJ4-1]